MIVRILFFLGETKTSKNHTRYLHVMRGGPLKIGMSRNGPNLITYVVAKKKFPRSTYKLVVYRAITYVLDAGARPGRLLKMGWIMTGVKNNAMLPPVVGIIRVGCSFNGGQRLALSKFRLP